MKPHIDKSEWPVLLVHWPAELNFSDLDLHFEEITALATKGEKIAIVIDMTWSGTPSASQRQYAAKRLKETYARAGRNIAGTAHVITSALVRGVLTAVYWLSPPPFQMTVVATRAEAIDWARRLLAPKT